MDRLCNKYEILKRIEINIFEYKIQGWIKIYKCLSKLSKLFMGSIEIDDIYKYVHKANITTKTKFHFLHKF